GPPCATFFPYPTLFRSRRPVRVPVHAGCDGLGAARELEPLEVEGLHHQVLVAREHERGGLDVHGLGLAAEDPALLLARGVEGVRSEEHTSELQSRENLV